MIQTIRGDTWDVGVVKHGVNFYLFSSYLGREFTVYKWFRDVYVNAFLFKKPYSMHFAIGLLRFTFVLS